MGLFKKNNNLANQQPTPETDIQGMPYGSVNLSQINSQDQLNFGAETYPQRSQMVNLREWLALKFTTLIFNGLPKITTDHEELKDNCERLSKMVNLTEFLPSILRLLVVYGMSPVGITVSQDGSLKWNIAQPFQSTYARMFADETGADLIFQLGAGQNPTYARITYTTEYIKSSYVTGGSNTDFQTINDPHTISKLNKKYELQPLIHHNLGIAPFQLYTLIPVKALWGNSFGQSWNILNIIQGLQTSVNNLYSFFNYELRTNRTLTFICLNTEQIKKLYADPRYSRKLLTQEAIMILPNNQEITKGQAQTSWYQIQGGNPNLVAYTQALDNILETVSKLFGLDVPVNATVKSASEVKINNEQGESLIRFIRMWFIECTKRLVIKSLKIMFKQQNKDWKVEYESAFDIQINDELKTATSDQIENSIALIESGLSTPILELAKLNNVTKEQAEKLYEEIKKYQTQKQNDDLKNQMAFQQITNQPQPESEVAQPAPQPEMEPENA